MKICVVTIYNGSNYGARLQALALRSVLEQKGHEVVHLDTGARNPKSMAIKKVIKRLITFDWRKESLAFQWNRGKVFVREAEEFQTCDSGEASQADLVLFGSDEIWNAGRRMIYRYPMLFGKNIDNDYKASYAVSINDATVEDFHKHGYTIEAIKMFQKITVRDTYSKEVLSELLPDKEISVVADPTLLQNRSYYESILEKTDWRDYILIYSYGTHLQENVILQMQEYAKKHRLKLISVLGYLPWCDENIPYSTKEVLGLIRDASVVFTDTFHGVIFSVIFEKQFAVVSEGTRKLTFLLQSLGLEKQKVDEGANSLAAVLEQSVDYVECNAVRNQLRQQSLQQLDMILDMKKSV